MVRRLVLDSSVIIKWLNTVNESHIKNADKILSEALGGSVELLAPELAKYEIGNVLLHSKKLTVKEVQTPLVAFYAYPINFVSQSEELANETYIMAQVGKITYYDASFMALAKHENAILVTDNPKHQGKTTEIKVISLADY